MSLSTTEKPSSANGGCIAPACAIPIIRIHAPINATPVANTTILRS